LAVVITGCDSGFGKEIAMLCAASSPEKEGGGFTVFACCLKEESFEQFRLMANVIPVKVDVTNDDNVVNVALKVSEWIKAGEADGGGDDKGEKKKKERILHALVNNAGIGLGFITDLTDLSLFQHVMDGT